MYKIYYTNQMKKGGKLMKRRGKDMHKLIEILSVLAKGEPLPAQNKDHRLKGNLCDFRECHIEPDWLLIYQLAQDELILTATATGTHSDLFGE